MSKFEGVWRIVPNTQSTQPFLCEYMKSSFWVRFALQFISNRVLINFLFSL
jgi:hypothetical protein